MNTTGWLKGLRVTADGTGIVSHAGVALLRALSDNIGLTGGLSGALASDRLLVHDRGRVLADLACAIADGAEVISDFRVMGDQEGLFGLVASVPTAWRTLAEIAGGGERALSKITAAVNASRRRAWAGIAARHGALPGIRVADKVLEGVTCIRLDASVVTCHSDKEGAEPNFKGFGVHPLLAYCDNTGEPLAGMLRRGSAGSNTAADHLAVLNAAIMALPPGFRRRLMVTCDGAGASHELIARLDKLAARPGYQVIYSVGWELGARERAAIGAVPARAWQIAIDAHGEVRERRADEACSDLGCGHRRCWIEEAHVTELTPLLREGPAGDQLKGWPEKMRIFARRERPHPGAQLTLFEAGDGWRYSLWVTNLPGRTRGWRGQNAYIDAAHRVHARVEDAIRTGKDCGIGKYPSIIFSRRVDHGADLRGCVADAVVEVPSRGCVSGQRDEFRRGASRACRGPGSGRGFGSRAGCRGLRRAPGVAGGCRLRAGGCAQRRPRACAAAMQSMRAGGRERAVPVGGAGCARGAG